MTKLRSSTLPRDAYTKKCPQMQSATARANSTRPWNHASYIPYIPLVVPVMLFMVSLSIPPMIDPDSAVGLLVLRSMLEGGAFNIVIEPDPANISRDVAIFLSELSPGQYIVPGALVWLGISYGLALSLTTFLATLIGVVGWIRVARSFGVTPLVLFVFAFGLVSFHYGTFAFRMYHGGEILLFAAAPWALYALRWAADKPPAISVAVSLLTAALLFFVKLTGLICFAANVLAISLLNVWHHRRLTSSMLGMWAASAISALLFLVFWPARDWGPVKRFLARNLVPGGWHCACGIFRVRSLEFADSTLISANRFLPGHGELRARTARAAFHYLGMGSTARYAVSDYGHFSIPHSCVLYDRDRRYIFLVEHSLFGGAPSPLFRRNIFPSCLGRHRPMARACGKGLCITDAWGVWQPMG